MTIGICSIFLEQSKGLESLDDMNIYNDELYVLGILPEISLSSIDFWYRIYSFVEI